MRRDYRILIIDSDASRCRDLNLILEFLGEPGIVATPSNWRKQIADSTELLTIVIGEVGKDKQALLQELHKFAPQVPLLLIGNKSLGVEVDHDIEQKVMGVIELPAKYSQVLAALHHCQIYQENNLAVNNQGSNRPVPLFRSLVGSSVEIRSVRKLMQQVAGSDTNVLILGESGTGKEVIARNLHYHSERREKPFVPVNCGAIPAELLESELFGHEKGSFTGAISARQGRFELAQGGTLFLDEIGDMPLAMQVKLLRVLEERTFERVGSNKPIKADVRIISATHRDLEELIEQEKFREDLYYRLNVFPIECPALHNRMEDIPLLINELISRIEGEGRGTIRLTPKAVEALCQYPWPGNVRELANLVERLAILYPNGVVDLNELPAKFRLRNNLKVGEKELSGEEQELITGMVPPIPGSGIDLKEHLVKTEQALIKYALEECDGVVARAAEYLNLRRTTLVEKMRKYGIQRDSAK